MSPSPGDMFEVILQARVFFDNGGEETVKAAASMMREWSESPDMGAWNGMPMSQRVFGQSCIQIVLKSAGIEVTTLPAIFMQVLITVWMCALWMHEHYPKMVRNEVV